jgi:hypothetical protein
MNYCNQDFEKMAEFCTNKEIIKSGCCRCIVEKWAGFCTIETNVMFND